MLYWPTERGSPCVIEDVSPHPTERTVLNSEQLERAMADAQKCFEENLFRMRMRYDQQIHDLYEAHAMWQAESKALQEKLNEQAPVQ